MKLFDKLRNATLAQKIILTIWLILPAIYGYLEARKKDLGYLLEHDNYLLGINGELMFWEAVKTALPWYIFGGIFTFILIKIWGRK